MSTQFPLRFSRSGNVSNTTGSVRGEPSGNRLLSSRQVRRNHRRPRRTGLSGGVDKQVGGDQLFPLNCFAGVNAPE